MKAIQSLIGLTLFAALKAYSVTLPTPSAADPRLQTVPYTTDIIRVKVNIGNVTEIVLSPGETVKEYVFGDRDAWWYSDREHIIRIKPKGKTPDTNVRVVTSRGMYWFDLDSNSKGATAYQLTLQYPPSPPVVVAPKIIEEVERLGLTAEQESALVKERLKDPLNSAQGRPVHEAPMVGVATKIKPLFSALNPIMSFERMSAVPAKKVTPRLIPWNERYAVVGSKSIQPIFAKDNGENTFIKFALHQPMPSIFAIAADGQETRVSYSVQDDIMVVQRVAERFVLRHGEEALCLVNLHFNPTGQTTGTKTVSPDVQRTLTGGSQ